MNERYSRQIILPEVGAAGQALLRDAAVLVVGAGGLGCAVLQYVCAAGVGRLTIVDHDFVDESNLHRQPLYRTCDLASPKTRAARNALLEANPDITVDVAAERLTPANVARLIGTADVVVDAADNFAVTYMLSDECHRVNKPLVSASVLGLSGYVGAFCGGGPSYRAVFPEMPRHAGSCGQSGVLGTAVGVMGTLQAHLVLALILKFQPSVLGELVSVDFARLRFGGFSFKTAPEPEAAAVLSFIVPADVSATDTVIDLRSLAEAPDSPFASVLRIEVDTVESERAHYPRQSRIVLCCRTGARAWRAARALQRQGYSNVALIAFGEPQRVQPPI
jgi:molybdopterin/thiamine biosynthesis adenylyltransferase/rhodanese-related sulfurtransferase